MSVFKRFLLLAPLASLLLFVPSSAFAAAPGVAWTVQAVPVPTSFQSSGSTDEYAVIVTNVGARASSGRVTLSDTLPEGVTAATVVGTGWNCEVEEGGRKVTCTSEEPVHALTPAGPIELHVTVTPGTLGPAADQVTISGGVPGCGEVGEPACPTASSSTPASIDAATLPFEPLQFGQELLNVSGERDTQAGDHPDALTTAFQVPSARTIGNEGFIKGFPVENIKQIEVELPPGEIADAQAAPTCSLAAVTALGRNPDACPVGSQVGTLTLIEPSTAGTNVVSSIANLSIINVTPEQGYPAEFAVYLPQLQRAALLYGSIGPGPSYTPRLISAPQDRFVEIVGIASTFFGNPSITDNSGLASTPLLTDPSNCSAGGFTSTIRLDSWQHPGSFNLDGSPNLSDPNWKGASSSFSPALTGCEALQFHPTLSAQPTTSVPDSPTGLNVELKFPQDEDANGLATPPLKGSTVTLPQGVVLSPSQANGLQACSNEQIDLAETSVATCPPASQIATVTARTPVLAETLEGQIFLGTPECSPCTNQDAQDGRLARLFIQIHSERYGITIKIPGSASINPSTGQVTATFDNLPQQPVEDLQVHFPEGPRAALSTPSCGTYTTTSDLTPWSSPQTPDATPPSSFTLSSCASNAFGPSFTAGTTSTQAGAYSPFELTFSRNDGEQDFSDVEQTLPPGLLAKLAGVQQCGNAEANAGTCPAGSRIGRVTAGAGPGSDPFYTTGSIYLTGPYNGGPFGEVVVVQAVAGPFNLGTVVVRGSIRINPTTTQATVVSDPFPTMLAGIPLQIRAINVNLERPGFTFNSTDCTPAVVTGKLVSTQGAGANVSSPYEPANCASLPFQPKLTASAGGKGSKANGATLTVKVTSKGGPGTAGEEANIKSVKVDLPLQLPSRLSTLQKACLAKVFEADPASCPSASDVGTASANTPLLSVPLSGPAYLVSHGGEAFPDLEMVLQGEGVTLILDGNTQIKKGITSSTFKTVPDAPISSFEVKLPTGKTSILGANVPEKDHYSLCGQTLNMPTAITGQNGGVVKQTTKIAVTNCVKAKATKKKAKAKRASAGRSGGRR